MRAWTISATILLGVTACSTGRNSVATTRPECAGPWLATVNNNGLTDAEVFVRRAGVEIFIGTVTGGTRREFQVDTPSVYASHRLGTPIGESIKKDLRVGVTCVS